jgi:PAS domain S-box-containing protein
MTTKTPESSQDFRQRAEELFRASETIIPESISPEETKQILYELRVHQIQLEMQNEELRRSHEELDAQKARYFDLYDLAPVGYMTLSEKRMIHEVNLAAANMLGVARKSLVKEPISRILLKEDQNIFYLNLKQCFESSIPQDWEMRLVRGYGEQFWAHLQATPAQNGEFWITLTDITERKQAEEMKAVLQKQFQQAQKLESLGVLAGGIAHDFNNILAIIIGYCYLIKMDFESAELHIPLIEKAAGRGSDLCCQMLAYAGKATIMQGQVSMRMLVEEMISMLKATINPNVAILPDLPTTIPLIYGDASQLRQIVMNLIINASEAIGEAQGEIRVSLATTVMRGGESDKDHLGQIITPGSYLCLDVTDNGCGMDEESRRRIFEPFYTTKFSGRGLGMSAVLGIITAHKGVLQITSKPGQGTTFKVYLPIRTTCASEVESPQQVASIPWKGSGTILLAEDENDVRLIAKIILKSLGFNVLEASNGKEALELYIKNASEITLVITDMGMPVMDGYELFRKLKTLNPKLPIIISSGYGDAEVGSRIAFEDVAGLVSKPYSPDKLQEVLKAIVRGEENHD